MGVTLFSDGTNQYYRITKRWGDKDHQYYVRVGKSKERALKEALAIEARLEQAARAHASVKDLTGENFIHNDGSIVGVALGFRQREGRVPNIEFKVRVAAEGKPVRFSTVSLNKYDFEAAFLKVIDTVAELRDVQKGSEAYSRLLATKSYYTSQFAAMNKELRGNKSNKASKPAKTSKKSPVKARTSTAKASKEASSKRVSAKTVVAKAKPAANTKTHAKKSKSAAKVSITKSAAAKPKMVAKPVAQKPAPKTSVPVVKKVRQAKASVKVDAPVAAAKPKATAAKVKVTAETSAPKKATRKLPAAKKVAEKAVEAPAVPVAEKVKTAAIPTPPAETVSAATPAIGGVERPKKSSTDDWEEMLSKEVQRFMQRKGIVRG